MTLPRDLLAEALGGNPRLVRAFEDESRTLEATASKVQDTVGATDALQDATVLTLSANAAFTNERVLALGTGLSGKDDGERFTVWLSAAVPAIEGGFPVTFFAAGECRVSLPFKGQLATTAEREVLQNKTLAAPKLATIGDHADDTAAATAGVAVGAVYRTGSALKVRVA